MAFRFFLFYIFAGILLSILLSGCFFLPGTIEVAPALRGRIINDRSGQPVCGARICYTVTAEENSYVEYAVSDENGIFQLEAPTQWHYIIYIGSPGYYPVPDFLRSQKKSITIQKVGYEPLEFSYSNEFAYQIMFPLFGTPKNKLTDPQIRILRENGSDLGPIALTPDNDPR